MSCVDKTVTLLDRYVAVLKGLDSGYEYSVTHFRFDEAGLLLYWNLEYPQPTNEQLAAVVVVKECPAACMGCIIARLSSLEQGLGKVNDDLDDVYSRLPA